MARLSGQNAAAAAEQPDQSPAPSSNEDADGRDENTPPFFNTTFSAHRVSPLHVGAEGLSETRLETIARRLRDILVGDVVRGIQIGLESTETSVGQVGALKTVQVRWFSPSSVLGGPRPIRSPEEEQEAEDQQQGLWVDIRHENAAYAALLLPAHAPSGAAPKDGAFLHLPLLLMRMPQALKNVVSDWLSTTFDCRAARMSLGTKTIVGVWENWIGAVGLAERGPEITITLSFHMAPGPVAEATGSDVEMADSPPQPGLKTLEITISPQDLRNFVRAGVIGDPLASPEPWANDLRERRRLAGPNADDGWAWRAAKDADQQQQQQPFTEALGRYLDRHLALNLFHPSVRVTQIACAGFVLGASRLKIVRPGDGVDDGLSRAAWAFVMLLGDRIRGEQVPAAFATGFDDVL